MERIGPCTVLEHVVRRVRDACEDVCVASPSEVRNGHIFELAKSLGVRAYIHDGPESDVLGRYAAVAREYKPDVVVRVTSDCPFIDPDMIRLLVSVQEQSGAEYVSNLHGTTQVDGHDCEVFTTDILLRADERARLPYDREHVTPWIRRNAAVPIALVRSLPLPGIRQHRWTLDNENDLIFFRAVAALIDVTPPAPSAAQLCALINSNTHIASMSARKAVDCDKAA